MSSVVGRLMILACASLLLLALIVANVSVTEFPSPAGGTMEWLKLLFTPVSPPAAELRPETHWVGILFLIIIPAMFGGLLAVLQIVAHLTGLGSDDKEKAEVFNTYDALSKKKPLKLWYTIGILAGLGGGLTVLIILALDGKFDQAPKDKDRLLFIGTGLISGYLGLRLVRKLSNQFLKEKTDALDEKANAIAKALDDKAKDLDAKAQAVSEKTDMISKAVVGNIVKTAGDIGFVVANTLADPDLQMPTSGITDAIHRLNEAIELDGTNRRNILFLARILRHQRKDCEGLLMGIRTLDQGISERRNLIAESDLQTADLINEKIRTLADDTAALYYNRSCYRAMIYEMRKTVEDRDASLEDIEVSLQLYPPNVEEVDGDPDFNSIRDEPRYAAACRKARERLASMPDGGTPHPEVAATATSGRTDSTISSLSVTGVPVPMVDQSDKSASTSSTDSISTGQVPSSEKRSTGDSGDPTLSNSSQSESAENEMTDNGTDTDKPEE